MQSLGLTKEIKHYFEVVLFIMLYLGGFNF